MIIPVESIPEERFERPANAYYVDERTAIEKDIMEIIENKIPICRIEQRGLYSHYSYRDVILKAMRSMMKARMNFLFPWWNPKSSYEDVPSICGHSTTWYDYFKIMHRKDENGIYDYYVKFDVAAWDERVKRTADMFRSKASEQMNRFEELKNAGLI